MDKEILYRYLLGQTTEEEDEQVLAWYDSDPENHIRERNELLYNIQAYELYLASASRRRTLRRLGRYVIGIACSVAVLAGVWFASDRHTVNRHSKRIVRLEVPAGERVNTVLEDGTRILLNAGTSLEYPAVFAHGDRRVKLSGEAIFEVQHDRDRPFVVETFASEIEVLGTKFSVDAREEHGRFSAMLLEGSVRVRSRIDPAQTVTMQPNDRVDLIDGELCKSRVPDFRDLCWTEGIIHFSDMPFDELMQRLEIAFNVDIIIEREALPEVDVRSGKIRISEGIDYALHVLQQVSDFSYSYDDVNNQVIIR